LTSKLVLMFKVNVKHFIGKNLIGIFDLKVNVDDFISKNLISIFDLKVNVDV
jgi:hypothetical protein